MNPLLPRIDRVAAGDGYVTCVRVWEPERPKGHAVFLHGIVSHGGWYGRTCRRLFEEGFAVHFLERRGSGINPAARGDVDRFETWLDDVENYLDLRRGSLPRVLLGISWGGKLAAAVAKHRPRLVDALAMLCPGVAARTKATAWQRSAIRIGCMLGIEELTVDVPLRDPALFTSAYGWQQFIRSDPAVLRKITLSFAQADLDLDRYAADAAPRIVAPTLVMLAGRDRIVDNAGLKRFFDAMTCRDKELIEYPDAGHTLEFENDPQPYLRDLSAWLHRVCGGAPACEPDRESNGT